MARYILVGERAINQEHIAVVALDRDGGDTAISLTGGEVLLLHGTESAAFRAWLRTHIKQWGADVLMDYMEAAAEDAMLAVDDL